MKQDTWLMVANSSLAHVYKFENRHTLLLLKTFEHPESRLHNLDLVSDKPGRDFQSLGDRRHALEPKTSPKTLEWMTFAKDLAHHLENARAQGEFSHLYLAASPTILGYIRQSLSPATTKLLKGEVDKDLTQIKPQEILPHLPFLF